MKKLIGLLVILLVTCNVFGQRCGNELCGFDDPPVINEIKRLIVKCQEMGWHIEDFLNERTYSFNVDNKLYVLSYDTTTNYKRYLTYLEGVRGDIVERNIYLYCLDNGKWSIVSDLVKTDYMKCDDKGNTAYDFYYPDRVDLTGAIHIKNGLSNGYVKKLSNGNVEILLLSFTLVNENQYDYHGDTILFVPKNNGSYSVIK